MRKSLPIAAALLLTGCLTPAPVPPPATIANQTVLDEQIASAAELLYKTVRIGVEARVDAKKLKGAKAAQAAELDKKMFNALLVVRDAYRTGNAADYKIAFREMQTTANDILTLIGS